MAGLMTTAQQQILELIDPRLLAQHMDPDLGYLDVLGPASVTDSPVAQRIWNSRIMASVYERTWRHSAAYVLSGVTKPAELKRAAAAIDVSQRHRLLDVACGPGNFTGYLARRLPPGGLAVGLDMSVAMLRQAIADNADQRAGYLRADAHCLPFGDESFDGVCCFAALYLVPDPYRVINEMTRVLATGGRIAILTSCTRGPGWLSEASFRAARRRGVFAFGATEITTALEGSGFCGIEQQIRGVSQFVSATKGSTGGAAE